MYSHPEVDSIWIKEDIMVHSKITFFLGRAVVVTRRIGPGLL